MNLLLAILLVNFTQSRYLLQQIQNQEIIQKHLQNKGQVQLPTPQTQSTKEERLPKKRKSKIAPSTHSY